MQKWSLLKPLHNKPLKRTEDEIIIEEFKNQTLSPFLWENWLVYLAVGILSIFFFVGSSSKLAIIRYIMKYAQKRPINQNILIQQVTHHFDLQNQ